MANSRFAYVRKFELNDSLLPATFLLVRIDGKGFHGFSQEHNFAKPNDLRALDLMNAAAKAVMGTSMGQDIFLAFGESDEYSFAFKKETTLYSRRASKITTMLVSLFTSFYVRLWPSFFPDDPLPLDSESPSFDGRIVQYPAWQEIVDYFKWRQVDTHINNLYNTCFWALVLQAGRSTKEAHEELRGTVSSQKHEMLFARFQINYNELPDIFKRGTILLRADKATKPAEPILTVHEDLLQDQWWVDRAPLLPR